MLVFVYLTAIVINFMLLCKTDLSVFCFNSCVGNLFSSFAWFSIYNYFFDQHLKTFDCRLEYSLQIFGIVLVTIHVTFVAMERALFIAYEQEISMSHTIIMSLFAYLYALLLAIFTFWLDSARVLDHDTCGLKTENIGIKILSFVFIGTIFVCMMVMYISYLLLAKKVFRLCKKNENVACIQKETLRRILIVIFVHFLLYSPTIISLLIPRDTEFGKSFFKVSYLMLHIFSITEPLILIFFDSRLKAQFFNFLK